MNRRSLVIGAGLVALLFAWGTSQKPSAPSPQPAAPSQSQFRCEGKTRCSQMTSCEEAKFYIQNCPGTQMDGDGDGVPCESQWCSN